MPSTEVQMYRRANDLLHRPSLWISDGAASDGRVVTFTLFFSKLLKLLKLTSASVLCEQTGRRPAERRGGARLWTGETARSDNTTVLKKETAPPAGHSRYSRMMGLDSPLILVVPPLPPCENRKCNFINANQFGLRGNAGKCNLFANADDSVEMGFSFKRFISCLHGNVPVFSKALSVPVDCGSSRL